MTLNKVEKELIATQIQKLEDSFEKTSKDMIGLSDARQDVWDMIQEMKRPIKNDLEIFGLRGSKKAEQNKIAERKDLKIVG